MYLIENCLNKFIYLASESANVGAKSKKERKKNMHQKVGHYTAKSGNLPLTNSANSATGANIGQQQKDRRVFLY
jgi:hypothetical protein